MAWSSVRVCVLGSLDDSKPSFKRGLQHSLKNNLKWKNFSDINYF